MHGGKRSSSGSIVSVVSGILISLPIVAASLYIYFFGVNMPFGDVWVMVPRFDKLSLGTLTFSDLWVQHFEHRLFFPRVAILLLGVVTEFNQIAIMYLTQFCFLITTVVCLVSFRRTVGARLLFFVPIPFLIFNLGQYFNMFYGLQVSFAFAQMFSVVALYLLYIAAREGIEKWAFLAALASAVVATFSLFAGLFVWPVGFLQLLVSPAERRSKRVLLAVWSLAWVAAWSAYLYGLRIPERQEAQYTFDNPILQVRYFLTALGSPLAWWWSPNASLIGGLLIACIIAVSLFFVYRAGKVGELSFWISLLAFTFVFLAALTLGRSGGGIQTALNSRYITFTVLALVGVYAILVKLTLERVSSIFAVSLVAFSALMLASAPFSYVQGINSGERVQRVQEREVKVLSRYQVRPDRTLSIANRRPETVKSGAFVMCKLGYTVFSDPEARSQNCLPPDFSELSPIQSSTPYRINTVAGRNLARQDQPIVVPQSKIRVTGWAVDARARDAASGVYIKIDDERFPAFYGRPRQGAEGALRIQSYEFSGFEQTIPLSEIGPGEHELSVVVVTKNRKAYYQPDQTVALEVKGEKSGKE